MYQILNLDDYKSIGTNWMILYVNGNNITHFDSFRVEHIPKEIKKLIENKNIAVNIFKIKAYDLIMCGYFCIGFIDFMLKGKNVLDQTNLFSTNKNEKNDKMILKRF